MILITGCAGFIGSNLCYSFLEEGKQILGIDNFDPYYDVSIKKKNLSSLAKYKNFTFLPVDITDKKAVRKLFVKHKFSTVIHLAARPGVPASIKNPLPYILINISGTVNLLEQVKNCKNTPFIFASSSSVYGGLTSYPFSEGDNTDNQLSPYSASKKSAEVFCQLYHKLYSVPITILRFFTVYGSRVRPDMAVFKFMRAVDKGEELILYNRGLVERDYTYIDDIVEGIKKAAKKKFSFEIINLGNNRPVQIKRVVEILENKMKKKARIKYKKLPQGEMQKTFADIEKAQKLLSWQPKTSIEEGLEKTVSWYKLKSSCEVS